MESMGSPVAVHTKRHCQKIIRSLSHPMSGSDVMSFSHIGLGLTQ